MAEKQNSASGCTLPGIGLFLIAFAILWWNEGKAVRDFVSLGNLGKIAVAATSNSVNPANEGKPVVVRAKAGTEKMLADPEFGVRAAALQLVREVEMFQWRENKPSKKEREKGAETSYEQEWSDREIESARFEVEEGHENPVMPYPSASWIAKEVDFGAFKLPEKMVRQIRSFVPLDPADAKPVIPETVTAVGGMLFVGEDRDSPKIGDLKVAFTAVYPQEVSLVAKQVGSSFEDYASKSGELISIIRPGLHSKDELIDHERSQVKWRTILLRIAGFVAMFVGLLLVFGPIARATEKVPLLGKLVGAGVGLTSFLTSAILTLATIAVAWIAHRTWLVITLGVIIGFLVIWLLVATAKGKKRR